MEKLWQVKRLNDVVAKLLVRKVFALHLLQIYHKQFISDYHLLTKLGKLSSISKKMSMVRRTAIFEWEGFLREPLGQDREPPGFYGPENLNTLQQMTHNWLK